jgi:hypothetical protein
VDSKVLGKRTTVCMCVVCIRNAIERGMSEITVLSQFVSCRCLSFALVLHPRSAAADC